MPGLRPPRPHRPRRGRERLTIAAHEGRRPVGSAIPLPGDAVDVIISNCVINLSADKRKVLSEAFRVLKPGGRRGRGGRQGDERLRSRPQARRVGASFIARRTGFP